MAAAANDEGLNAATLGLHQEHAGVWQRCIIQAALVFGCRVPHIGAGGSCSECAASPQIANSHASIMHA